jgi:hypothetical protein
MLLDIDIDSTIFAGLDRRTGTHGYCYLLPPIVTAMFQRVRLNTINILDCPNVGTRECVLKAEGND